MEIDQQQLGYTDVRGEIRYLDGAPLQREPDFPRRLRVLAAVIVVIACIVGAVAFRQYYAVAIEQPAADQAELTYNLARQNVVRLVDLPNCMTLSDEEIKARVENMGNTFIETSDPEDYPNGGFTLFVIPDDVTYQEAEQLLEDGFSDLSPANAALLLNGSWWLNVYRDNYTDLRVKYCDFTAKSVDEAVTKAMSNMGLTDSILGDSGVDDYGNTYQAGNIEIDEIIYSWRISACELSWVYDYSGFPDQAYYVSIRITE